MKIVGAVTSPYRQNPRRVRRSVWIVMCLSLVLAACGGQGAGPTTSAPGTQPTSTGPLAATTTTEGVPFYEGKNITMIIPYPPGGGTDVFALFMAAMLREHLPGNPNVNPVYIEGADSLIGANEFAAADPDGLTVLIGGGGTSFNYILSHPDAEYDYADFTPLVGLPLSNIIYARSGNGVETAADLKSSIEPLAIGESSVSAGSLTRVLSFHVLDLDVQLVTGYAGRGPTRIAFEQGELNLGAETTPGYLANVVPLIDSGIAIPIYTLGEFRNGEVVRDSAVPDVPHIGEAYEMLYGSAPAGETWEAFKAALNIYGAANKNLFIHRDAPQEAIEAMQLAVRNMLADPAYEAAVEDVLGGYHVTIGDELAAIFDAMLNVDPAVVDWIKDWLLREYDVDLAGT